MNSLPSGTVTFLFTDIEGSTKLAQQYPRQMPSLLNRHHEILRSAIHSHNGYIFQNEGDSLAVAFHSPMEALNTASIAQKLLQSEAWSPAPIKVRMGIHTGTAQLNDTSAPTIYTGYTTLATTARIMSVGHGRQVLLSEATQILIRNALPTDMELIDLGEKRLKDLLRPEHLYQLNITGLQMDFPPLKTLNELRTNLPAQLTSFIGREKEVEQIKSRLGKNRLVTLTGSGGIGKTRLSIQIASELLSEYPHGAWLVELASITDPEFVTREICAVLDINLPGNASPLMVLTEYLQAKKLLLVVDNCEHLIETCAQICDSLLHACPNLSVLASSREALGIDGENGYHVPSLSLPDPKSGMAAIQGTESVKLFTDRATAVLPEFELSETNASSVAQICKRLDGIPLAIELAASRVKLLKVEQIASRLNDVFRLLTGGSRTALPRQQTLRALIDWSYNLLSEPEKILFRRLAVFAGGWTMEAAESICSGKGIEREDVLDLMAHLMDKSLIVVTRGGTESRYRRLETIRQYAREKLAESGESEILRNRHLEYFGGLVERFEPGLRGPDQVNLMDILDIELDNLRTALEWTLDHNASAGIKLASQLKWFWHIRNHENEGVNWLVKFLIEETEPLSIRSNLAVSVFDHAKALITLSYLAGNLGEMQKGMLCATEGLALCEKMSEAEGGSLLAECYYLLSGGAVLSGDLHQAKALAEKSLTLYQRLGDKFGIAEVQSNRLLPIALRAGELETAHFLSEANLAIRYEIGDQDGITYELFQGGIVAMHLKNYELAQKLFLAAIDASQLGRSVYILGLSLGDLGVTYLLKGEMEQARTYFLQVAKLALDKWFYIHKALTACLFALYGFETKQYRKFIKLMSFLESKNFMAMYLYSRPILETAIQKNMAIAHAEVGEEIFRQADVEGKALTLDQAFDYVLEEFYG
ncbi:MAG TPA: adenylate/guanylate cyclase domain-containing protein [Anaerolineales bacterium]|nr:adenylate/guanylate cyclase domain-containing protein [Anaerolineales bacterium]